MEELKKTLICIKSYGDYVIARWAAERIPGKQDNLVLAIGDHLIDLDNAIGRYKNRVIIKHTEGDVPAIFDVRKKGVIKASQSFRNIRSQIGDISIKSKHTLIFDKIGIREILLAKNAKIESLGKSENIYNSYITHFQINNCFNTKSQTNPDLTSHTIGIFPSSRVKRKQIPAEVLSKVINQCNAAGITPTIFQLTGDAAIKSFAGANLITLKRTFDEMTASIKACNKIVSADSMPAHMGELFNKDIYVLTPNPNKYWLPLSCFKHDRWSTFEEILCGKNSLYDFIT